MSLRMTDEGEWGVGGSDGKERSSECGPGQKARSECVFKIICNRVV